MWDGDFLELFSVTLRRDEQAWIYSPCIDSTLTLFLFLYFVPLLSSSRYHCLTPEWPCLSFDILQDALGGGRTR